MINRYDDFTKLQEMVLGKVNYSALCHIENKEDRDFMKIILEETEVVLEDLEKILKDFDVKVWRPEVYQHTPGKIISTPYVDTTHVYSSLTPFDNFLTIGNTVVEMSSYGNPSAVFDHTQYQHIWAEQFRQGARWLSMPRQSHNPEKSHEHGKLPEFEPYADSPSLLIVGNKVFVSEQNTVNVLGLDWFKKEFPQFEFIIFKGTKGHLDSYFSVVKPGLALSGLPKECLPSEFDNWTILEFEKENYQDVSMVSEIFQDDDYDNTTLPVNVFSINESNIIMSEHTVMHSEEQVKSIEANGVNIIPVQFNVSKWLNQGIHCLCNPISRAGKLTNYFE